MCRLYDKIRDDLNYDYTAEDARAKEAGVNVWHSSKYPRNPKPRLSKETMIPDRVLLDILRVFTFGEEKVVPQLPNNLICQADGSFWTTWEKVIKIRQHIKTEQVNVGCPTEGVEL